MEFQDLQNVVKYYEESIFPKALDYYKKYYWDLSERKWYIKWWQSNQPAKIFARIVDTFWSRMYDNKFKFNVSPNSEKDISKAKDVSWLLTWAMQVSNLKQKFWASAKDALIVWEWYGRIKYTIEKNKVEYINPVKGKQEFYTKDLNFPDYSYISPFNIMVDPTASSFDSARYVIARRVMTPEQTAKEFSWIWKETSFYQWLLGQWEILYSTDWLMSKNNSLYKSSVSTINSANSKISFNKKKYLEVIEYWEDNVLKLFINWTVVYDWINPMPIKKIPFIQLTYLRESGSPRWIWLWFQLWHIEDIWTATINSFLDDMKLKSTPVYKQRVWLNSLWTSNWLLDIQPWDVIPVEDPNDLTVMELGRLNYDLQNLYQFLLNEAMMIAWVNDIVMWWPLQKVDRSATSTSWRIESFKARTLNFFDSINYNLGKISEMWLGMIIAYNKWSNFSFKVFDDNTKATQFSKLKLEDIAWQFDIIFDTQALKSALRDIALQKKMNFLQVASQLAVDPITQTPVVDLKKLVQEIWYDMDLPEVLYTKDDIAKMQQQAQAQPQPQQAQPQQAQAQPEEPTPEQQAAKESQPQWDNQVAQQMLSAALNPNW